MRGGDGGIGGVVLGQDLVSFLASFFDDTPVAILGGVFDGIEALFASLWPSFDMIFF